jgi:hypothetical protein
MAAGNLYLSDQPRYSFGASLGQSVGAGLGGLLQGLVAKKVKKNEQREISEGLQALGYTQAQAESISKLSPDLQKVAVQNQTRPQKPGISQAGLGALQELGINPGLAEFGTQALSPFIQSAAQAPQNQAFAQALQGLLGGQQPQQQMSPGQELTQQPNIESLQGPSSAVLTAGQTGTLAKLGLQQQQHRENIALKKEQFEKTVSQREQSEINKETQKFYEETHKKRKAAQVNDQRLGRMETLINEGNLQNPVLYGALKKVGLDIPALQSANSQEFVKLTTDFLRNAKDVFGSRVTNYDAQAFLKTVPELSQSDEGKKRIIRNMRLLDKGEQLRGQAQDSIIKENGGKRPRNLESLVEDRVAPELDALAQQFKAGAEAPLSLQELKPGTKFKTLQQADSLPVGAIIKRKNGQRMQKTETGWKPAPTQTNQGV